MSKITNEEKRRIARSPFITIGATILGSASIALIVLVLLFGIIIPGRHNARKNCQAALDVRDAVVFVLKDAKRQSAESHQAQLFYDRALNQLNSVRCKT